MTYAEEFAQRRARMYEDLNNGVAADMLTLHRKPNNQAAVAARQARYLADRRDSETALDRSYDPYAGEREQQAMTNEAQGTTQQARQRYVNQSIANQNASLRQSDAEQNFNNRRLEAQRAATQQAMARAPRQLPDVAPNPMAQRQSLEASGMAALAQVRAQRAEADNTRTTGLPMEGQDIPIGQSGMGRDGKRYYRNAAGYSNSAPALPEVPRESPTDIGRRNYLGEQDRLKQQSDEFVGQQKAAIAQRERDSRSVRGAIRGRDGVTRSYSYQG